MENSYVDLFEKNNFDSESKRQLHWLIIKTLAFSVIHSIVSIDEKLTGKKLRKTYIWTLNVSHHEKTRNISFRNGRNSTFGAITFKSKYRRKIIFWSPANRTRVRLLFVAWKSLKKSIKLERESPYFDWNAYWSCLQNGNSMESE